MILAIVGGLVVFLLGCVVVLLGAVLRHLRRALGDLQEAIERLQRAAEEQTEAARRQAEEAHKHHDATAAVVVAAIREVGRAIVGELRRASDERREVLHRLMEADPPSAPPPSGRPTSSTRDAPSARGAPSTMRSRALVGAGPSSLPPKAPTAPSGAPVLNLRMGRAEREGHAQ